MALAAKVIYRADKYGYSLPVAHPVTLSVETSEAELGALLLGIIDQAQKLGIDSEIALRSATQAYIARIHEYEAHAGSEAEPSEITG